MPARSSSASSAAVSVRGFVTDMSGVTLLMPRPGSEQRERREAGGPARLLMYVELLAQGASQRSQSGVRVPDGLSPWVPSIRTLTG